MVMRAWELSGEWRVVSGEWLLDSQVLFIPMYRDCRALAGCRRRAAGVDEVLLLRFFFLFARIHHSGRW